MNNITITDSDKFAKVITSLENSYNKLREIKENENINKEVIDETDVWTSNAQKSMYNKFDELVNIYEQVDYSLDIYIKFLKKTLEDYTLINEEISRNIEKVENELNINS
jgi:hypothetical protein